MICHKWVITIWHAPQRSDDEHPHESSSAKFLGNKNLSKKQNRESETMSGGNLHLIWKLFCFLLWHWSKLQGMCFWLMSLTSWVHPGCWLHSSSWVIRGLHPTNKNWDAHPSECPTHWQGPIGYNAMTKKLPLCSSKMKASSTTWAGLAKWRQATHRSAIDS